MVNLDAGHDGVYRCVIRDTCGNTVNSQTVNLTVNKTLVVSPVPAGDTLCEGSSLTFPVSATGSNLGILLVQKWGCLNGWIRDFGFTDILPDTQ